jgi:hypothetical protein
MPTAAAIAAAAGGNLSPTAPGLSGAAAGGNLSPDDPAQLVRELSGHVAVVSGTLTYNSDPVVFPEMPYVGLENARPQFLVTVDTQTYSVTWMETEWVAVANGDMIWESSADVATPDLVPTGAWNESTNPHAWKPMSPAGGVPSVAIFGAPPTIAATAAAAGGNLAPTAPSAIAS